MGEEEEEEERGARRMKWEDGMGCGERERVRPGAVFSRDADLCALSVSECMVEW